MKEKKEIGLEECEPKTKNSFIVSYGNIEKFVIKAISGLSFTRDDDGEIHWDNIFMELHDVITPSTPQSIFETIENETTLPMNMNITILGPMGDKVSEWTLHNPKIVDANFGEFDWDDSEPNTITLEIKYDKAVLEY